MTPSTILRHRPCWQLVVAGFLTACSLDGISSNLEPETGPGAVYTLVSVNGKNVPAQVVQGQTVLEVTKGALTLATDSTYIVSYILRASGGGTDQISTQTTRGTYTVGGTTISMRLQADTAARYRGTYSASDVSITDIGVVNGDQLAFRR